MKNVSSEPSGAYSMIHEASLVSQLCFSLFCAKSGLAFSDVHHRCTHHS